MSPKKILSKKKDIIDVKSLVSKKLNLNRLKVNPINAIDSAKNKIINF